MKVSLKWLSKYINIQTFLKDPQKGPLQLADLLTNAGLEVEGIENQAKNFNEVVIGQILEKNKHPNADNLTLCIVTTGDKQHRIVCGAKNHQAGDKVVLALPGAVLPGDFAIRVSKIRGEESHGMLCSEKELGLAQEGEGILILPASAPVGESFAKFSKRDDVVLDLKVTPNRSDCLSHFGLAREVSAHTGEKYEFPLSPFMEGRESTRKLIKVTVEDAEACPRYAGRLVLNVKVGPSPEWLKRCLEAVGLRSINNVVDVTNFVMMELGQPLHAFDLSKLEGSQIVVRRAREGEKFTTLDEKELTLDGTELVIADAKKPVALAGVMGGLQTGVNDATKDVFIESAYFLPSTVRRASRRHGLETDSSYRFSRGVDPDAINLAMNRACQLLVEVSGATVCTDSYDNYPRPVTRPRIELDLKFMSARLGVTVEGVEAKRLLERVGCDVAGSGDKLLVNPPAFRGDLKLPEDLAEEILRLKGFQHIPESLPQITSEPSNDVSEYALENRLAQEFRALGLSQATNLSFIHSKFQEDFLTAQRGQPQELGHDYGAKPIRLKNPLNQELDVLRLSLLPGLLKNVLHNVRHGKLVGALFEVAPVFGAKESEVPQGEKRPFSENSNVAGVMWGNTQAHWMKLGEAPLFFKFKGVLEEFLSAWQFKNFKFEALNNPPGFLHPGQSARLIVEGKAVGVIGHLHPGVAAQLELKVPVVVTELNLDILFTGQPRLTKAKSLPKFPKVERDVALLMPQNIAAGEVRDLLAKAGHPLVVQCEVFDLYEGEKLPENMKSVAFRLVYQDAQKTLSDDEVNAAHQKVVTQVCQKLNLSVR